MFLKLTLYNAADPNLKVPIMINMDKVIAYGDYYNFKSTRDPVSHVITVEKERVYTCITIDNSKETPTNLQVCETMKEINLKMAQLERRKNDNNNR